MFSYLDAGTGSMIVTAIAGGIAGIGVAGKMFLQRLKSKVTGKRAEGTGADAPDASSGASDGTAH